MPTPTTITAAQTPVPSRIKRHPMGHTYQAYRAEYRPEGVSNVRFEVERDGIAEMLALWAWFPENHIKLRLSLEDAKALHEMLGEAIASVPEED